jgi:hypothetical protein
MQGEVRSTAAGTNSIGPALAAPLGQSGTACRVRPDTVVVIDMSETSSGRSWSPHGVTGVSGGESRFSDRKSLLGCETWRLAPHRRATHCSASSDGNTNTGMVQGYGIINDFLHGVYSVSILTTQKVRRSMNVNTTNSSVTIVPKPDRRAAECDSAV